MSTVHEIGVVARSGFGKNASRRARKEGLVPVNVYAKGKENRAFALKSNEWEALTNNDFNVIYLVNGDEKIAAVVKDVQINYLKSEIVHIDFLEIDVNASISAAVAVHSIGSAAGLSAGGVMEQMMHEMTICGPALSMPEKIEVDVTALPAGGTIAVKDVILPEGFVAEDDPEQIVFHIVSESGDEVASEDSPEGPEVIGEAERAARAAAKEK